MKKFGTKTFTKSTNAYNEDDSFFQTEMSKKLKSSMMNSDDRRDSTLTLDSRGCFRFKEKTPKDNKCPSASSAQENFSYAERKYKRLSELQSNNLYFLLDLTENCTKEEIKISFRKLCKVHHPDKGGDPQKFHQIHKAYKILSNENFRCLYDKMGSSSLQMIETLIDTEDDIEQEDTETLHLIIQM